jgi:hypothetical protein
MRAPRAPARTRADTLCPTDALCPSDCRCFRHVSSPLQVDDTVKRAKEEGDLPLHGYKDVCA